MIRCACLGLAACLLAAAPGWAGGEIFGTVTTQDGETYTGPIRWDRNENYWNDILDARKDRAERREEEGVSVYLFGYKIIDVEEKGTNAQRNFTIPFGHIRSIEPVRGSRVDITLKNGETIHVRESGTDLGRAMRDGLIVFDSGRGKTEIDWLDLKRIEFSSNPGSGRDDQRLYGQVHTIAGGFTGFIVWDLDEAVLTDELDGEERGRDREIPFGDIREIHRVSDRQSRVILSSGREHLLHGTNDVNADNRGIMVTLDGVGTVTVHWREFDKVVFEPAPASPAYDSFDGGRRLAGTVTTREGDTYTGEIVWDNDEEWTWEELDGEMDDIEYAVQFDNIESIRKRSRRSAEVRLRNGEVLVLEGTNDVNSGNSGIIVRNAAGEEARFDWDDFERVEFTSP